MRRPQMSELTRSESCQSGPVSRMTTFLPAFASVAANTEPDAPAPTMTASTFSRVAMSPPLHRHDVRHVRHAECRVALDRSIHDVDRIAAQQRVDEWPRRSLPSLELVLPQEVDEPALIRGGKIGEPLLAAR